MVKNIKDNSFKKIFGNRQLFCEFIVSFIKIDLLKDIKPEDVEDITQRFITAYKENRDTDTVKRIKIKGHEPLFVIGLIEHQSAVHYLMVFRILEYMVLIWKDYIEEITKEAQKEKKNAQPSKKKEFKLPPIIPIVFHENTGKWTAETNFKDKVYFSDIFSKYIPEFEYKLVDLGEYSKDDLLELKNLLSLILLIDKIKTSKDFEILKQIPKEYIEKVTDNTSKELLLTIADIVMSFLEKVNAPKDEIEIITEKIYERSFVEMFTLIEKYDVQETRKIAKQEGMQEGMQKGIQEGIQEGIEESQKIFIKRLFKLGESIEKIQMITELPIEKILEIKEML